MKVKIFNLILMMLQFLSLTSAGPPLVKVLNALKKSAKDRTRATIHMRTNNKPISRLTLKLDNLSLERAKPIKAKKRDSQVLPFMSKDKM